MAKNHTMKYTQKNPKKNSQVPNMVAKRKRTPKWLATIRNDARKRRALAKLEQLAADEKRRHASMRRSSQ
jgi:replication initiation and membrane attachment protein DnaB